MRPNMNLFAAFGTRPIVCMTSIFNQVVFKFFFDALQI